MSLSIRVQEFRSALEKSSTEDDRQEVEDNAQTIRPTRSPAHKPIPLAQAPPASIQPIFEDYSDLASDEDEGRLQEKVADFKVCLCHVAINQAGSQEF